MRQMILAVLVAAACVPTGDAAASGPQGEQPVAAAPARVRPGQGQGRAAPGQAARVDVGELQRLFDAYLVMQAQEALQLDDEQFGRFLPRLKHLQATRRRHDTERQRIVADLARMTSRRGAGGDEALRRRLEALQDLDGRAAADTRRAYDELDQQLDVFRQARFRVFEQNMERRKLQLMLRARRAGAEPPGPGRRP